jgi:hypothetical protein
MDRTKWRDGVLSFANPRNVFRQPEDNGSGAIPSSANLHIHKCGVENGCGGDLGKDKKEEDWDSPKKKEIKGVMPSGI